MIWKFSDGTTVELGGKIEGATLLAQRIRAEMELVENVPIWPAPSSGVSFDRTDPALLDFFLQRQLDFWTRIRGLPIRLTRPDAIPALPPPPWGDAPAEVGRDY